MVQKEDEKNWVITFGFISPALFMVLKLSKMVSYLQFFADTSKKTKGVIAIYYMHLKVLVSLFQKMVLVIML